MRKQIPIAAAAALALAGLTAELAAAAPAPAQTAAVAQTTDLRQVRAPTLQQTNQRRATAGLPALRSSASLDAFAQDRTQRQVDERNIFHCDPPADFGLAGRRTSRSDRAPTGGRCVDGLPRAPRERPEPAPHAPWRRPRARRHGRTNFTQNRQLPS